MTKTLSMLSISLGLLASACATGANYPGSTQAHQYELVSLESEVQVRGVLQEAPAEPTGSGALSMFERFYPVHPLAPAHGAHEEPVTP